MAADAHDPRAWLAHVVWAVHTDVCTYLLDEGGVCRVVLSPDGAPAPETDRCVGAQFVACLDPSEPGQLVGELRIGATALFACLVDGRFVLLRTAPVAWVEERGAATPLPVARTAAGARPPPTAAGPADHAGGWSLPLPPPTPPPSRNIERVEPVAVAADPEPTARLSIAEDGAYSWDQFSPDVAAVARSFEGSYDPDVAPEDLVTFSEVTLTIPLYRSEDPPPDAPRPNSGLRRGQRLR